MKFSDDLKKIGTSEEDTQAHQQHELNLFQEEMRPAKEFAEKAIVRLEKFFRENAYPIITAVEAANVRDIEIGRHIADLRRLAGKPEELKIHLEELRRIGWKQICSHSRKDQVDAHRRADLMRYLGILLTKFGDIEGSATLLVGRIKSRVAMLAARAGAGRDEFPFILDQPARPMRVLTNLDHE